METVITKPQLVQALDALPETTTIEAAIEQLQFLVRLKQGLAEAALGAGIAQEEIEQRISRRFAR